MWLSNWRFILPKKNIYTLSSSGKWSYKDLEITRFGRKHTFRLSIAYWWKRNNPPIIVPPYEEKTYLDGSKDFKSHVYSSWSFLNLHLSISTKLQSVSK